MVINVLVWSAPSPSPTENPSTFYLDLNLCSLPTRAPLVFVIQPPVVHTFRRALFSSFPVLLFPLHSRLSRSYFPRLFFYPVASSVIKNVTFRWPPPSDLESRFLSLSRARVFSVRRIHSTRDRLVTSTAAVRRPSTFGAPFYVPRRTFSRVPARLPLPCHDIATLYCRGCSPESPDGQFRV